MKRFLLLLLILFTFSSAAKAGSPPLALPKNAQLVSSLTINGTGGEIAVAYRTSSDYIGVEAASAGTYRLVWSRKLIGRAERIKSSPHPSIFLLVSRQASPKETCFAAYRVSGPKVESAVVGASAATQCGNRGISLGRNRLLVRQSDSEHKGSLPYRFQTIFAWSGDRFAFLGTTRAPDLLASNYPVPNGTVSTKAGDLILIKLEVANTDAQRSQGLMDRKSLDPDSGMVFVWNTPTDDSFWMYHTYVPLTVAFLDANGKILEMQDMAPLTTVLHSPAEYYMYAIEVNQGFFKSNGIQVGDTVLLHLK